jgi:rfaE bifunctional protein nucleotidyltransferase chain/domain
MNASTRKRIEVCTSRTLPAGPSGAHRVRRGKIGNRSEVCRARADHARAGRTVAWTNGCFDLLHAGHVLSLQAAAELADVLIVGLNSDESVQRLKGPGRPILPQQDRALLLAALECVDHVLVFDEETPECCLQLIRPALHVKGADYAPPHGKFLPEKGLVERQGGRVVFLPLVEGISTSEIIGRIQQMPALGAGAAANGTSRRES